LTSTAHFSQKMMITTIALVSTLLLVSFAMPAIQIAKAQYVSSGGPSASLEEQLKLAREKVKMPNKLEHIVQELQCLGLI
jgi:hypothetical protein